MAIAVHGLTYYHDGTSDAPSLSDISLQLPSGSRTVIVGANGGMCFAACSREPENIKGTSTHSGEIHFAANPRRETPH